MLALCRQTWWRKLEKVSLTDPILSSLALYLDGKYSVSKVNLKQKEGQ